MGEGYTWETQDRERDARAARTAWEVGKRMLSDAAFDMVVLDELNITLKHGHISVDEVIVAARARTADAARDRHRTQRTAELIEIADTVTEMKVVKHAFQAGIRAQAGVEL